MKQIDSTYILNQMPGICFIKDLNLQYAWVNQAGVSASRFKTQEELIGKSDYEMPWHSLASKFVEQDLLSLQGKVQFTIEENPKDKEGYSSLALLKKVPFFSHNNNIDGILCIGFEVSRTNFNDIFSLFMGSNLNFNDFKRIPDLQKQDFIYGDLKLSKRQAQLISYLLKGHCKKSIAKYLNLSPKTVEYYFNNIKEKLDCKNWLKTREEPMI